MSASSLAAALQRIGEVQARLPGPAVGLIGIVAFSAAFLPDLWLVSRHVTVMAHEGAHAAMGSAIGRRVTSVTLRRNAEGLTTVSGGRWPGNLAIAAVGYLGPSAFGLCAAELISIGHIDAVLWLGLLAVLMLMGSLRASFGIVTVICTFVVLFWIAGFATASAQVLAGYAIAWFLLVSGIKVLTLRRQGSGDSEILRGMTRIPHGFWYWVWLLGSLTALGYGGSLML
jgi:hypothetical protein